MMVLRKALVQIPDSQKLLYLLIFIEHSTYNHILINKIHFSILSGWLVSKYPIGVGLRRKEKPVIYFLT